MTRLRAESFWTKQFKKRDATSPFGIAMKNNASVFQVAKIIIRKRMIIKTFKKMAKMTNGEECCLLCYNAVYFGEHLKN
jgi:hypothetical protein